ncbi:S-layer homology domain-containing protein [Lysinibacillus fusiformis]|uniref:S-layer homology domain-containing protein n=1 Tax=Lysinibacillus fusiformis TaxID=28031 RepID=UPI0038106997
MAKQNKGRKFFAASATAALVASAIVPVASAAQVNDYNKISGYAKEAVQSLVDKGVIQGDTNGNFNPLNTVTRAQAAEIFTKALELEADGDVNFSDVKKGAWYYNSIAAVVANGIFEGVSANEFAPNKSLTRSEAAKVLVDAFGLEGSESLGQFADASQVKAWAKESLEIAVANGIFTGSEENGKLNLKPNAAITRQDFAVVFARTLDLVDAENPVDASIKAINNTTVEVTFDEEVDTDNVKAENFTIEGLKVTNAAVKQSDKKVVVLTTEAQTADKEYTLSYKEEAIGKFKGVSAVIPTAVNISEKSLQAQVGTQVTLKAQVTVAEGQSKAGIPVTFNIVNNAQINTATLNQPIVAEAKTDENGVATYTYTRYAQTSYQLASHDEVQAYATGNPTARSFSKVYWANIQPLAITEVTAGNTVTNGGKKVYKVKAALGHAEPVLGANGVQLKDAAGNLRYKVNIGYQENINVTPDKAIKTVDVIDSKGQNLSYPGQFTSSTSGSNNLNNFVKEVELELDANGEAVFTLSGSNAAITPFVFVDQKVNPTNAAGSEGRFEETELFAASPKVTFSKVQTLGLDLKAEGVQYAASFLDDDKNHLADSLETIAVDGTKTFTKDQLNDALVNTGGRDYKATVTDKNGKTAPAGTPVKAEINIGSALKTNGGAVYVVDNNTRTVTKLTNDASTPVTGIKKTANLTTNAKGEVSFTLIGYKDAYATPTVYVESGDKAGLDANDLQQVGEIVYFSDAVVKTASLTVDEKSVTASETVEYTYSTVDQNGKAYRPATTSANYLVTFEVSTTFNPVNVTVGTGSFASGSTAGEVAQGSTGTGTFVVKTNAQGVASIKVSSKNAIATSVNVVASASDASLPQLLTASNEFTTYAQKDLHARVNAVDTTNNTVSVSDVNNKAYTYSYAGQKLQINGTDAVSETAFEAALDTARLNPANQSLSIKLVDGTYIFNVLTSTPSPVKPPVADTVAPTITSVKQTATNKLEVTFSEAVNGLVPGEYFVLAADNTTVGTVASATAVSPAAGGESAVWTLTTTAALPATATTLEYVGTGTVDVAATPNKLVSGTKAALTKTTGLVATKTATTAGVAATKGEYVVEVAGTLPTAGSTDTITFIDSNATTPVAITFSTAATTATQVAKEIADALKANGTISGLYDVTNDGVRVHVKQKVANATGNSLTSIALTNATGTTFASNTTLTKAATAGTAASQNFAITENLSGVAVAKDVTITIGSDVITKSVTFGAADNTPALVAQRIANAFAGDGSLTAYSFTEVSGELVVAQASNFAPVAINVTIK